MEQWNNGQWGETVTSWGKLGWTREERKEKQIEPLLSLSGSGTARSIPVL
jgi:hypothetical protein